MTDNEILNAAINAADELDATRVSEMTAGVWKATTIFNGDTGLVRFGRLVEEIVRREYVGMRLSEEEADMIRQRNDISRLIMADDNGPWLECVFSAHDAHSFWSSVDRAAAMLPPEDDDTGTDISRSEP